MSDLLLCAASSADQPAADTEPRAAAAGRAADTDADPGTPPAATAKKAMAKKAAAKRKPSPAKKVIAAKKAATAPAAASSSKGEDAAKAPKKTAKPRSRLVRDSFTMPESDFNLIASLKARALGARRAAKKSEMLRAGLRLLSGLEAKALVAALDKLEAVKIGRPKKGH